MVTKNGLHVSVTAIARDRMVPTTEIPKIITPDRPHRRRKKQARDDGDTRLTHRNVHILGKHGRPDVHAPNQPWGFIFWVVDNLFELRRSNGVGRSDRNVGAVVWQVKTTVVFSALTFEIQCLTKREESDGGAVVWHGMTILARITLDYRRR